MSSSFSKSRESLIFLGSDWVSSIVNSFLHKGLGYCDKTWAVL